MLWYGYHHLNLRRFTAKIGMNNVASLQLFSRLGFAKTSESKVFQEVTLELNLNVNEARDTLCTAWNHLDVIMSPYHRLPLSPSY